MRIELKVDGVCELIREFKEPSEVRQALCQEMKDSLWKLHQAPVCARNRFILHELNEHDLDLVERFIESFNR